MDGRYIRINGVNYYISVMGHGMPVLLLHGFTGSHKIWQGLVDNLKDKYTFIVPDLLGHGLTDCPNDESRYSMEATIEDLVGILDMLQIANCVCLGYSMGGRIALALALNHFERLKGLILESASPGLPTRQEREERIYRDRMLADRIETIGVAAFAHEWANIPLFSSQKRLLKSERFTEQQIRFEQRASGLAQSLKGIGTGVQPSFWSRLDSLQVPTFLITGELDEKFTKLAQTMACQIPNACHQIVQDAGHTVHLERPLVYHSIVKDWLWGWYHENPR